MNHTEFATLVAVYELPIPWLAKHIGRVSERSFRYWCNGRPGVQQRVPADAVERMQALNAALYCVLQSQAG